MKSVIDVSSGSAAIPESVSGFEYNKLELNYFADQVDTGIQNNLVAELMLRYSEVSRQLAEKNTLLRNYNENLEELVSKKVKEISDSQIATIHALIKAAETRDDDTGAHIERTSQFCGLIAQKLRETTMHNEIINEAYIEDITMASPLHDIGKIAIPDAILLKPAKLTTDEFEIMKTHVSIGSKMLQSIDEKYHDNAFIKMGIDISKYHHEKWDGSGYTYGLSGKAIPLAARIMALSDVYDALRSRRVYKEPFSHEKAVEIISESSGTHFDPAIADVFLQNNAQFDLIYKQLTDN